MVCNLAFLISRALTNLAVLYFNGTGVKRNYKESVRLLRIASDQSHARAQTRLAFHLLHGKGCTVDKEEAVALYIKAAENGMYLSSFNI
jgi:TPR repeat protein